jgi:hypothetical protein
MGLGAARKSVKTALVPVCRMWFASPFEEVGYRLGLFFISALEQTSAGFHASGLAPLGCFVCACSARPPKHVELQDGLLFGWIVLAGMDDKPGWPYSHRTTARLKGNGSTICLEKVCNPHFASRLRARPLLNPNQCSIH